MRQLYWTDGQENGYKDMFMSLVNDGTLRIESSHDFMRGRTSEEHESSRNKFCCETKSIQLTFRKL